LGGKIFRFYQIVKSECGIDGPMTPEKIRLLRKRIDQVKEREKLLEIGLKEVNISRSVAWECLAFLSSSPIDSQKKFIFALYQSALSKSLNFDAIRRLPSRKILQDMGVFKSGVDVELIKEYWPDVDHFSDVLSKIRICRRDLPRAPNGKRRKQAYLIILNELQRRGKQLEECSDEELEEIIRRMSAIDFNLRFKDEGLRKVRYLSALKKGLLTDLKKGQLREKIKKTMF
jgi:hypothetical protein